MHTIGSFPCTALGEAEATPRRAGIVAHVKARGLTPEMDISDPNKDPNVRGAAHFLFDLFQAGGFPTAEEDAALELPANRLIGCRELVPGVTSLFGPWRPCAE